MCLLFSWLFSQPRFVQDPAVASKAVLFSGWRGWGQSWPQHRVNFKHVGSIRVQTASRSPSWRLPLLLHPRSGGSHPHDARCKRKSWQTPQPMCQRQAPTLHCLPQQQSQRLEQEVIAHNIPWRCIYSDNVGKFEWNGDVSASLSAFFYRFQNTPSHLAAKDPADLCCSSIALRSICVLADTASTALRRHVYYQMEKGRRYYTRMQPPQVEWNVAKYTHFSPQNYYLYTSRTSSRLAYVLPLLHNHIMSGSRGGI